MNVCTEQETVLTDYFQFFQKDKQLKNKQIK